mmetsp:Transcript_35360/g.114497  ORF Transcript_35360/g.114497 Transcript_35360/m.114497 type:complete len:287 (-) Transcript_35360:687-1547(-)
MFTTSPLALRGGGGGGGPQASCAGAVGLALCLATWLALEASNQGSLPAPCQGSLTSCCLILGNSAALRSRAGIAFASVEDRVVLLCPPSWHFATSSIGSATTSTRGGALLVLLLVCFFNNSSLDSSPVLACEGDLLQLLPSACSCDDLRDGASPRSSVDGESCDAVSATNSTFRFFAFFFFFTTGPVIDDAALLLLPVSAPCGDMLLGDDLSLTSGACAFKSFLSSSSAEPPSEPSPSRALNPFRLLTFAGARPTDMDFCVKETFSCAEREALLASVFNFSSLMFL